MSDMNDCVALITGASSGIGRATAELFAAKGARVVVAARRQDELDSLVATIEARGGTASAVRTDVSVSADVGRMVDHAITKFGRLDYASNNAGIEGQFAGITELEEDEWDRVLGINLKGTFLCIQREARPDRADHERLGGTGPKWHSGQSGVPGDRRHADAPQITRTHRR